MHNDDRSVGRLLTRRQALLFGGAASAIFAGGQAYAAEMMTPALDCVVQPEQTEGPFFVDRQLQRSDIRTDPGTGRVSQGVPLTLRFALSRITPAGACAILPGAHVDIWHCDANGVYSNVRDRRIDTSSQQFLRGYQISDAAGAVSFTTIYPGWYSGRAVHIHFKIRVPKAGGRADEFTSQLYFDDALTDRVHAQAPYSSNKGQRLVNGRDMIFRESGASLMLPVEKHEGGYAAVFRVAMRRPT